MKEISLRAIRNAGFEIIKGVDGCYVYAPIILSRVDGGKLSDLDITTCYTHHDEQDIDEVDPCITFTILKDGREVEFDLNMREVKEYFEAYFENHPEELDDTLTIGDILRLENVRIEEKRKNLYKYAQVDLDTIHGEFESGNYITRDEQYNDDFDDPRFNIYKNDEIILDDVKDDKVREYLDKLAENYR